MIYVEQIINNNGDVTLQRQRNSVDKVWYGMELQYTDCDNKKIFATNESWILDIYVLLEEKKWSVVGDEMNVCWDGKGMKTLRKILRSANELGWFSNDEVLQAQAKNHFLSLYNVNS